MVLRIKEVIIMSLSKMTLGKKKKKKGICILKYTLHSF